MDLSEESTDDFQPGMKKRRREKEERREALLYNFFSMGTNVDTLVEVTRNPPQEQFTEQHVFVRCSECHCSMEIFVFLAPYSSINSSLTRRRISSKTVISSEAEMPPLFRTLAEQHVFLRSPEKS